MAEEAKERLSVPLLILSLILAAYSEGVPRAIYILAVAFLATHLVKWSRVQQSVAVVEENLRVLDRKIDNKAQAFSQSVSQISERVSSLGIEIRKQADEVTFLKNAIATPQRKSGNFIWLLIALVLVTLVSNVIVLLVGRTQLAEYGDKIGQLIGRLELVESASKKASAKGEDALGKTNVSIEKLSEEVRKIKSQKGEETVHEVAQPVAPVVESEKGRGARKSALPGLLGETKVEKNPTPSYVAPSTLDASPRAKIEIFAPSLDGAEPGLLEVPLTPTVNKPEQKLNFNVDTNSLSVSTPGSFKSYSGNNVE